MEAGGLWKGAGWNGGDQFLEGEYWVFRDRNYVYYFTTLDLYYVHIEGFLFLAYFVLQIVFLIVFYFIISLFNPNKAGLFAGSFS